MTLHHIVYLSSATKDARSEASLQSILSTSVQRNKEKGVTGMLLFSKDSFLQVLEGEEFTIRDTFARIGRDARHHDLHIFLDEPIFERTFPDWSMGYRRLSIEDAKLAPEFAPYYQDGFSLSRLGKDSGIALYLLKVFAANGKLL